MEGMFVEMDRGGVSDTWRKTINVHIVNTQICLGTGHLYRLISLSFSPFGVSSKRYILIRFCNVSPPGLVGIWC